MPKIFMKKTIGGLIPTGNSKYYERIKIGKEIEVEVVQARNVEFHRKFFALINLIYENQEIFNNIDLFREQLTLVAGHYHTYKNHKGNVCFKAKSISFAKMDQLEFNEFYESILKAVAEMFDFDVEETRAAVQEFY